uniref:receptor-like protein kinase HERK 1 isoform X3 n=1 Tax=Erigeron canadensis TaxID=72917 RepID=UPI001CB90AE9|nr:receptor-like protein kinase HERK 1 isoform X3 [Erigeron canadensis]
MCFLDELESLRIPFGDIKEATKNFTTIIGKGGYGLVYKGELLLNGKLTSVAIKRLDGNNISGQGFKEFLTEIQLLTRYKHPNLIALIGFCDQDNEKILIYEHAEHGSLDKYLTTAENRSKLTWKQRINICVNAARGLNFLHSEVARNERVIHRDIKCANILLDRNWKAMVSDLGLSKLGRANEKDTYLITNASGTHGYCDPVYISSGILTKESDVYSFGVVLFEVLCGRLCFINVNNEHRFLPPLAQRYCKLGKIDEIMDPVLKNQIDSDSLNKFSKIAFQCLQNNRKRRPSMSMVVKKLEELERALEFQPHKDTNQLSGGEPPNEPTKSGVLV